MWYWHHDHGWGWFVVVLLRRFGHPLGGSDADRTLDERFARGEIARPVKLV